MAHKTKARIYWDIPAIIRWQHCRISPETSGHEWIVIASREMYLVKLSALLDTCGIANDYFPGVDYKNGIVVIPVPHHGQTSRTRTGRI